MPKDQVAHALTLLEALNQLFFGKCLGLRLVLRLQGEVTAPKFSFEILRYKIKPHEIEIVFKIPKSTWFHYFPITPPTLDGPGNGPPPPPGTLRSFADWLVPPEDLTWLDFQISHGFGFILLCFTILFQWYFQFERCVANWIKFAQLWFHMGYVGMKSVKSLWWIDFRRPINGLISFASSWRGLSLLTKAWTTEIGLHRQFFRKHFCNLEILRSKFHWNIQYLKLVTL